MSLLTVGVTWLGVRYTRQARERETHTDEAAQVLQAWKDLVEPLRQELADLRIELTEALARILELEKREAYLDGKLHEKETELEVLRQELETARFNEKRLRQQLERHRRRIYALEQHFKEANGELPNDLPEVDDTGELG